MKTIPSKGFAARNTEEPLSSWEFERRPLGENDILIDIKFSGICHSDIHQIKGHWGEQQYPQVPGHEIAGIVTAVGDKVTAFKVGDKAGVGCMVDGCTNCENEEQYQSDTLFTYGYPDKREPTGITQGGYATNIVVRDHYAIKIPDSLDLQYAAPLLCAGITTYSPLMKFEAMTADTKVGVVGIGGLGHMAIQLAVSKGAEVYAFTTTPEKSEDIKNFGAKEVIVVEDMEALTPWKGTMDYMISTVPYAYEMSAYIDCVKPNGYFTQVGQPVGGALEINNFNMIYNRVNFNGSLIGGIKETQEMVDYCAENKIYPQIELIEARQINDAWKKVVNKEARYRYVIDTATL
ncbi:NAD(P)-dependent alcohol dehydrogenase [Altibacter sp. HG106]|uniref:NAD(P)-dependent alcohol dehydrogenase n=1 Tax=Altibacter sp. HG106 TaxID=3023937 RepID=UPI002350F3AB|nr:NAD(P)-dependent alcohol dehydrogenase [Altibacter sp. HG106]MDC7995481.1 NAD(P)-dependent alcohol dehydrogenase [Altibacter sp. HG106]